MKKKIILTFLTSQFCLFCMAQNNAENIAQRIAQRMKDSLALTAVQKDNLYQVNMQLSSLKNAARTQYHNDTLTYKIQRIENSRDSLYHIVLPEDKYLLYKQKKKALINNN